jgi:hypothetical protein
MINEFVRMWWLPSSRHHPSMFLERLRKATKSLSHDGQSPGRDLKPGPLEYEAGVLTTRARCSIVECLDHLNDYQLS